MSDFAAKMHPVWFPLGFAPDHTRKSQVTVLHLIKFPYLFNPPLTTAYHAKDYNNVINPVILYLRPS